MSDTFGVGEEKIYVCSPGPPVWRSLGRKPNVPGGGSILFVGTLEPRKNIGALLDAYETLLRESVTPAAGACRSGDA